ncbi:FAD-binding oxidoreductase [Pseudonocardia sp. GCM10023141]|uniref:FAD-binding oxidoreductase n=1 Tax=Pseudonocardia sp. GCM10023141 TaxID=3252653 RepID=UPI003620EE98
MTSTVSGGVEALRTAMGGAVLDPSDPGYDAARAVWNAAIDRRPAVIARCSSAADVSTAIGYAQATGLEIAVRCGAHSMSGASTVDGGLVVDLSGMRDVTVDPQARRARVAGGALLADVDAATQAHGLAVPLGAIGHTGVGGLTLGGGMGWLTRQAGLSIDNLVSAEVVVADGRILRACADENAELFWAIRGGGGNFGVVTEFEFRLHEVGPMLEFGLLFWGVDQAAEALRVVREVLAELPRSMNGIVAGMSAPPEPFVPEQFHFRPGFALMLAGFGDPAEHARVVARLREAVPPLFEHVSPMPYVALQQMIDEANAWGRHNYEKSTNIEALTDGVIEVLTEHVSLRSSPLSIFLLYRLDEAYADADADATAFGGSRIPQFAMFTVGVSFSAEQLVAERNWVRGLWDAMQPHSLGVGSYVNGMTEQEEHRVLAAYGRTKYDRLARIKREYDPANVFHRNINIRPA